MSLRLYPACVSAVQQALQHRCTGGKWTVYKHSLPPRPSTKLDALLKTIDAVMRQEMNDPRPVKAVASAFMAAMTSSGSRSWMCSSTVMPLSKRT